MAKIGRNSSYVYVPQFLRDIRKECTHMKKRFLSTLMALCLALSLLPATALAADALPATEGEDGYITLESGDYALSGETTLSAPIKVTGNVTLDLAGYTLRPAEEYSDKHMIKVSEGGNLTLTDSGKTGKITTNDNSGIRGISNNGTFTMTSGAIEVHSYAIENIVTQESYSSEQPVICNINGGELSASYAWTVLFMGAGMAGQYTTSNGRIINSIHTGTEGSVRNDLMQVNISGNAKITGDQALTTNASNGVYAGFTLNISGNAEISGGNNAQNCGIYLPAVGETNISGGHIVADQAIRIAAGKLNITGGIIDSTAASNAEDLVAGASGGTMGALVIGKAGGGYVGDILVNIEEKATIRNVAEGDDPKAAIVVSDKHMSDTSMGYNDFSIEVNVNGATVDGNVVKVSNVKPGSTSDGGDTTLTIQDATVTGNVTNQSQTGLIIRDTTINGNVSNTSNGSTAVLGNSTIIGDTIDSENGGTLYVENGASTGTYYAINERTSKVYTDLNTAISEADDGDTITLLDDVVLDGTGKADTQGALTIGNGKTFTLNGNGNTIFAKTGTFNFDQDTGAGPSLINVQGNSDVTFENVTLDGKGIAKHGLNINGAEVTLDGVTITNNRWYAVVDNNDSTLTVDGLTTTGNQWGVNIDKGAEATFNNADIGEQASIVYESAYTSYEGGEGSLTIKGGTYNTVKTQGSAYGNVAITGGRIDTVQNSAAATVEITGGTIRTVIDDNNTSGQTSIENGATVTGTVSIALGSGDCLLQYVVDGVTVYASAMGNADSGEVDMGYTTTPTKPGSTFDGWACNHSGITISGNRVSGVRAGQTYIFTARWTENQSSSSDSGSDSEPSYSPVMDVSDGGSVKVNPRTPGEGDEVTITVDPDAGYEVDEVTVTDRSGREVDVTAGRDGTYTFEQPKGRVTIAVTFVREGTSTFFTDVAETYWAYDEIAWAYENGYVNGVTATTFAPGASISRQQIWMILARIAGDDPADMAAARQWSIDNGISDGTNPGSAVTRQQLAALLYRYAQMMGYANEARVDLSSFPDAGSVASYAVEPMQWSVANSIVGGTTDGTLNPTGTATRAQFAVMLYRFWTGV